MNGKKEFGDYQTPLAFARDVCGLIKAKCRHPEVVIEPTCGTGNFLKASLALSARDYYGIELDPTYCEQCRHELAQENVQIVNADIFAFDLKRLCADRDGILVLGNPPWATNAELSRRKSDNVPHKENIKSLEGFDALTGASNFDIAEYIILKAIDCIREKDSTLAMLCKTSVARNVFCELNRRGIGYRSFSIHRFNARNVFRVSASACLLLIEFGREENSARECKVYDLDSGDSLVETLNGESGSLRTADPGDDFNGRSCFEWRQGVKHDCSKVMELSFDGTHFFNGEHDIVDIENDYVFPLIKSSMFKHAIIERTSKYVIVTQTKLKQDTASIQSVAPHTWQYLCENRERFERRKSSIYRNTPPFSMFGIGEYSFAKYKLGISGFYKEPLFAILKGDAKPIMTDDTSYFIPFDTYDMAYTAMLCLNSERVRSYLLRASFRDAKRPYTKHLLNRLDFGKITNALTFHALSETESRMELPAFVKPEMYDRFKQMVSARASR